MSNLDNLISKILGDCKEKANQITADAERKASEIMNTNIEIAEKEKDKIIKNAESDAQRAAEHILLTKKLQIRDAGLAAKQETLDKVFKLALEKLNDLPKDKYEQFAKNKLSELNFAEGENIEIILPKKYSDKDFVNRLNTYLDSNGKKFKLRQSNSKRRISSGFVLVAGGTENNYTFDELLNYYRYELEGDIIKNLF